MNRTTVLFVPVLVFFVSIPSFAEEPASAPKSDEGVTTAPSAPLGDQFEATYRTGSAPIPEKTRVTITKTPDGLTITPQKKGGEGWTLPIKSIRGAQASVQGLWLFWFDETDNTLTSQFKMEKGQVVGIRREPVLPDHRGGPTAEIRTVHERSPQRIPVIPHAREHDRSKAPRRPD